MKIIKHATYLILGILCLLQTSCNGIDKKTSANNPEKIIVENVLKYVDPMVGTGGHGHTFPGPTLPHGRIQLSPDTQLLGWEASSGYSYADTTLYGFSHTHLSGTGIGDLGDVLLLPFTGEFNNEKPVGAFSHDKERAEVGYYKVTVEPWNVISELTTTLYSGRHRYQFPKSDDANVMVDLAHILQANWGHKVVESSIQIIDEYTIQGYRKTSGWAANDPIWFTCVFDKPILSHVINVDGKTMDATSASGINTTVYATFGKLETPLNVKVAVSAVDQAGAKQNLNAEADLETFDDVVKHAQNLWNDELQAITITSKDTTVLKNFYTALYHTKIAPMLYSDADGRYRGMDNEIHKNTHLKRYSAYSLWDTFRAWYPLMTIIEPDRSKDWVYDLYQQSQEGGLLPKWQLNGNYTGTMVGYPAVAILSDAVNKGLIDSIPNKLLDAALLSSKWQPEFHEKHKGTRAEMVMPEQIYYKEKMGFVPLDKTKESVSYGLEMAYYDWCIAKMADALGAKEIAETYYKKGEAYKEYFDPEIKFMRGKNSDGSWGKNFNPRFSNHLEGEFVEGNSYQWTPFLPHAVNDFATMLGGKKALGDWLDNLFTTSSEIEGDNASADITGLIGQYAHGNEPSHHVPYMYQFSDRPWRTQEVLDSIMKQFYTPIPEGIIGNEDCGQMSAWYVLNAIGLYQMTPGDNQYYIGRPMIDSAEIKLKNGSFKIEVMNNSAKNKYVEKVLLNGKKLEANKIEYNDIKAGSVLEIYMSPNK
ncbi:GH92 family glycosyl hydrolase [Mariniflexile sp.]|uniref:GH92 family glycosyl hydrolase n=1 Tax=Mariniflexile sp. TaxID=1979402 RepID=UPI00404889FF